MANLPRCEVVKQVATRSILFIVNIVRRNHCTRRRILSDVCLSSDSLRWRTGCRLMRRVCHRLTDPRRWDGFTIQGLTRARMASWKCYLRPIGSVVKHELLLNNLSLLMKVGPGLYGILNSYINRYDS